MDYGDHLKLDVQEGLVQAIKIRSRRLKIEREIPLRDWCYFCKIASRFMAISYNRVSYLFVLCESHNGAKVPMHLMVHLDRLVHLLCNESTWLLSANK